MHFHSLNEHLSLYAEQNILYKIMEELCSKKKVLKNVQNGEDTYCTDAQVTETKSWLNTFVSVLKW